MSHQRSKLTFSKSRLLATFNCKMVAIKKFGCPKKLKGRTLHDILHKWLMRQAASFQHFTLLQYEKEKEETALLQKQFISTLYTLGYSCRDRVTLPIVCKTPSNQSNSPF